MSDDLFSVAGQVVFVSGGSRGIGKALAAGFAQRDARVIITGRDAATLAVAAAEINSGAHDVCPLVCDVTDSAAIAEAVERVLAEFGQIDTLINVAGVNRRMPSEQLTEEDYDHVMNTNLKGAWLLSQAVGRAMLARGQGNQINIASLTTDHPLTYALPYAMSKAGIGHMTRVLAAEWGPGGVRVNALAPGFILTDLNKKLWASEAMQQWGIPNTPQRRLGTPADLVGTAIFLASEASAFVTGHILYVDGGFSAARDWPINEV